MARKNLLSVWTGKNFQQKAVGIIIVLFFAGLGIYLLTGSHAAAPYASVESANGALNGTAQVETGNGSDGSYVQFGSNSAGSTVGESANDEYIWTACNDIEGLSETALAAYKSNGIAGFVCEEQGGYLYGMGNDDDEMTSNLSNPNLASTSTNAAYSVERALVSSNIVAKAHAAGLKIYYNFWLDNYYNVASPLEPWFNDSAWTGTVESDMTNLAGAAKAIGFDGLAMDSESYNTEGLGGGYGQASIWVWNGVGWKANFSYSVGAMFNNAGVTYTVTTAYKSGATFGSTDTSNTTVYPYTQAQTDAEVELRGQQMMGWITAAFPNVQILNFGINLPDTWDSYIVQADYGTVGAWSNTDYLPFWDGMTSGNAWSNISIYDEDFYEGPNYAPYTATSLNSALQYNANSYYAVMSQNFKNWAYAADRIDNSPSIWIDGGDGQATLSVNSATSLMDAYTKWSVGNILMDYANGNPVTFNYTPYYPLFQTIAKPTTVDTSPPTLTVSSPSGSTASSTSSSITMTGDSTDNFAVRDVKYSNSANGDSGAAVMTYVINSGSPTTGFNSQTNWTMTVPLQSGTNKITITVEDIHGLTTSKVITVTH